MATELVLFGAEGRVSLQATFSGLTLVLLIQDAHVTLTSNLYNAMLVPVRTQC